MKNLILIRHAKSSWGAPVRDFDRPLNDRGIADAGLVANNFQESIPSTYTIQASSARRARETATIFAKNISFPIEHIVFKEELYTFNENALEKIIKNTANDIENCILFGHNEAITNFVNKFGNIFIDNVPTSGLVWLQFDTNDWNTIKNGKTIKILFPKNLK